MKQGHKYFLNVLLSNIQKRIIEVETSNEKAQEKVIRYRTILEQISEQYNKSQINNGFNG